MFAAQAGTSVWIVIAVAGLILFLLAVMFAMKVLRPWLRATRAGIPLQLINIIGMWLRKTDASAVIDAKILLHRADIDLPLEKLEVHCLAGGNVDRLARALIMAREKGIDLAWKEAAAIDLAGRDVLELMQKGASPETISVPDPEEGPAWMEATSADGVAMKGNVRITIKLCGKRIVGGAPLETIASRVRETIVKTISEHKEEELVWNRELLEKALRQGGLDQGTAYELLDVSAEVTRA